MAVDSLANTLVAVADYRRQVRDQDQAKPLRSGSKAESNHALPTQHRCRAAVSMRPSERRVCQQGYGACKFLLAVT
ncbi:hypothetical protein HaLaN_30940 [Haematococcus lacustris]|uniref:Uncharacterized protein n=1 Tax=Haematococcus lacustris TaxID=44745 RepID=A0A6A0AHU8_HAELA|nr:hypothetical protein HaLaN_30940 [Haematococcus lacustris]